MRREPDAQRHSPVALAGEVTPRSPWRVTEVEALTNLRLRVAFADGVQGFVDLSGLVSSPGAGVFASLANPSLFRQARIEYGVVTWPGELDLAPDAMHDAIRQHGEWRL